MSMPESSHSTSKPASVSPAIMRSIIATARSGLWPYLDRCLLGHLRIYGGDRLADDLPLDEAVNVASDGESGYTMSNGRSSIYVQDGWLEIILSGHDWWVTRWATSNTPALGESTLRLYIERDFSRDLTKSLKRAKLSVSDWREGRRGWTLGRLRAAAAVADQPVTGTQ